MSDVEPKAGEVWRTQSGGTAYILHQSPSGNLYGMLEGQGQSFRWRADGEHTFPRHTLRERRGVIVVDPFR